MSEHVSTARMSGSIAALAEAMAKAQGAIWSAVPGAPRYLVSECGDVVSLAGKKPRLLKPIRLGRYQGFTLLEDGRYIRRYTHRLVAEHCYGHAPAGMECRHIDGNRDNNIYTNLRWGTRRENHADKKRHGTSAAGEKNPMAKLTRSDVDAMKALRLTGLSYRAIADRYSVATMTAFRAIKGETWA